MPVGQVIAELSLTSRFSLDMIDLDSDDTVIEGDGCRKLTPVIVSSGKDRLFGVEDMWPGCSEREKAGDFNGMNGFTLGDAIYVATMWAGAVPTTKCLNGDFNG